ncbi:RNA polymerase sigma-70 factor [Hymenobacter sp.]|uniref:RNA polymerase sigma-70 factor n=1 Tax=Hymenobacter sp. TaxID=1898978 RepID=UPI00286C1F99|nr:RNA polymerase sigma-70 factor [Hymenobacter sp.]
MAYSDELLTELVNRLRKADEAAFRTLYDLYKSKLYWYCLKFTKSEETAEEMVQDVFVKIWEKKETLNPELSINAYLYTLAKHLVLNHQKKTTHATLYAQQTLLRTSEASNQTEVAIEYADYLTLAHQAIAQLPPKRHQIFQMSRQEEMSHEEIASALGISKHTVNVHLVKALKYIRATITLQPDVLAVALLLHAWL